MMLRGIRIARPKSLPEALHVCADLGPDGRPLAGGTDLVVALRRHPKAGLTLIDLSLLHDLRGVREEEGGLWIGALTPHEDIARSPLVRRQATALAEACAEVGSVQIRNRGTIGGNVANASPCADGLTALVALQAEALVASVRGTRTVAVEGLVERPYRTGLAPDELILGFRIEGQGAGRSAFVKLGRRDALAIARINAGCVVEVAHGRVNRCRLAVGSIMPRTERVREAEDAVIGAPATEETARLAGDIVAQRMVEVSGVRWSTPYKDPAVRAIVTRVVLRAIGR